MKIVFPIHSFETGGVERTALLMAREWQNAGHDVVVILGRTDGAMAEIAPGLRYEMRGTRWSTAWCETLWMIVCLYRYLRSNSADILFCPGNTYAIVAGMMCVLLGRKCPPVISKISNDLARRDMSPPLRLLYRLWLLFQAAFTEVFVGMASPMREEILRFTRATASQVEIIEDPSLTSQQLRTLVEIGPRRRDRSAGIKFLSIGRLVPQKNYRLLISAFADAAGSRDRLTIIGEGPERRGLERLANRLGVGDRVSLPGHSSDTTTALATNDVFVLSSDYEGVPAVIIEALAAGLPIISTECSVSLRALLQDGAFGEIIEIGNRAGLASAIGMASYIRPDQAGARRLAGKFEVERAANAYLRLFANRLRCWEPNRVSAPALLSITQM